MTEPILLTVLFVAVMLLTVLYMSVLLPMLHRARAAQPILQIGPSWHNAKAGTPTLGGLSFILAILTVGVGLLLWQLYQKTEERTLLSVLLVLLYALCNAAIGFVDDYCKLRRRENKGLSAAQKYFLQLLAAAAFLLVLRVSGMLQSTILLPFTDKTLALGRFYYPLALLFLTGMVNALNLTDGLDGLLSSTVAVVALFFVLYGAVGNIGVFTVCGACLLGGVVGFLFFNAHPAKVFMGDTGSLFLGAMVAGVGIVCARPVTVLLSGGVFVFETVSVALQVVFFKCSGGKRLFKMAPFHHHLEKCGMREGQVVSVLVLFSLVCCAIAYLGG